MRTMLDKTLRKAALLRGSFSTRNRLVRLSQFNIQTADSPKSSLQPVIGLEVHAQIASCSKLFSGAATNFGGQINNQVSHFDASIPGTLPVINKRCVEAGVLTALALNCHVNTVSTFDRKHYFYADLPAGYQITQQNQPLAKNGHMTFLVTHSQAQKKHLYEKTVHIVQLQLEQDSGKSLHDDIMNYSLIDLNRAGVGLMEIVTAPDFKSGEEAMSFIKELQLILQRIGTCSARMDEGAMRVDASISLHIPGEPLGTRTEVKNINSIRYVARAIDYEIKRQQHILDGGGEVENETRAFDYETGETVAMRDKEKIHDYRFMAEPNLPPLQVYHTIDIPKGLDPSQVVNIDDLAARIPELPKQLRRRLQQHYNLTMEHIMLLVSDESLLSFFEATMVGQDASDSKTVMNILSNDVAALLNEIDASFQDCPVEPGQMSALVDLLVADQISMTTLKQVLDDMFETNDDARTIVERRQLWKNSDPGSLENLCREVFNANPHTVQNFKKGKKKSLNFLLGQVQKQSRGTADAKSAAKIMSKLVEES